MANKNFIQEHGFKIFLILSLAVVAFGFLYPMLRYPYDNSNPWPEAYQVIQKSIIDQQKVPPDYIVQYGEKQPSDMVYFLNHHLMLVSFQLLSGQSFGINERFLTVVLTFIIFLSAYLFFEKIFGTTKGFLISFLFIFLPRELNYYTNVNGEFLSFIILFVSLYFIFDWIQRHTKNLIVGVIIASILPVLCLINFGLFGLIVSAYLFSELLLDHDKRQVIINFLKFVGFLAFFTLIVAILPLYVTGNLRAGKSSSIGSLYAERTPIEIESEKKYYDEYATYGNTFIKYPPLVRDFYYLSFEGTKAEHLLVYYGFIFFLGLALVWRRRHRKAVLFGFILAAELIFLEALLYSKMFNENVYNAALRFLLYFSLPMVMMGGVALKYLNQKNQVLIWVFILSLSFSSISIIQFSAHSSNMYSALYATPYKQTLAFAKKYIPDDTIIMTNDWTNGQFYVEANKLNITESGKASATYSTYEHIYSILKDARTILSKKTDDAETLELLKSRKIKYVILWNRPAAYSLYPYNESNQKFSSLSYAKNVFSSSETLSDGFFASTTIYRINLQD